MYGLAFRHRRGKCVGDMPLGDYQRVQRPGRELVPDREGQVVFGLDLEILTPAEDAVGG